MDTPFPKKHKVMDMPIYLQFLVGGDVHRLFVIEERDGADKEAAASDELPEELWVRKSDEDRVRVLNLPKIEYDIYGDDFAVAESRLFFIGREEYDSKIDDNGIVYIDFQSPNSWERFENPDFNYVSGAAVSDDSHWIYAVTDQVLCLNCHRVGNPEFFSFAPILPRFLVASTGSKMLLYSPSYSNLQHEQERSGHLGFFDLESHSWEMIHSFSIDKDPFAFRRIPSTSAVIVGDSFLIDFAPFSPKTLNPKDPLAFYKYHPALYVYDIRKSEWLLEPVQGLDNDGIILPLVNQWPSMSYSALMQVQRDVLKLALVWSTDEGDQTEVHWSKFILRIYENGSQDIPPTFHAQVLSSGTCSGGDTLLIRSAAG